MRSSRADAKGCIRLAPRRGALLGAQFIFVGWPGLAFSCSAFLRASGVCHLTPSLPQQGQAAERFVKPDSNGHSLHLLWNTLRQPWSQQLVIIISVPGSVDGAETPPFFYVLPATLIEFRRMYSAPFEFKFPPALIVTRQGTDHVTTVGLHDAKDFVNAAAAALKEALKQHDMKAEGVVETLIGTSAFRFLSLLDLLKDLARTLQTWTPSGAGSSLLSQASADTFPQVAPACLLAATVPAVPLRRIAAIRRSFDSPHLATDTALLLA